MIYSRRLNKGFSSRLCVGSRVRHKTPEEGRRNIGRNVVSKKEKKMKKKTRVRMFYVIKIPLKPIKIERSLDAV